MKKKIIKKYTFILNKLFNVNRSITGPGNRQTLKEIKQLYQSKLNHLIHYKRY